MSQRLLITAKPQIELMAFHNAEKMSDNLNFAGFFFLVMERIILVF